jgi:F-type H+-transporting ATPase subunit a
MTEHGFVEPQLPNFIDSLARTFGPAPWTGFLLLWQDLIFSLVIACIIVLFSVLAVRRKKLIPGRAQNFAEIVAGGIDDFICGVLGPRGRAHTPFIGTLFIYILLMNLAGLIPFIKSPTANWSTTLALSLCVFGYVQYTAFKELNLSGYFYHLMGKPKGFLAASIVLPLLMLFMHIFSELIRPISLSLRLRSNIWGDDMLLAVISGFGIAGMPLVLFNYILAIIASVVQAMVFCLLTLIYLALFMEHEQDSN